jgi:hypothetical protein
LPTPIVVQNAAAVYTLRRFMDDDLRVPAVYKLPPEFMTAGDENAKG